MGTRSVQCTTAFARWTCPHTDTEPAYSAGTKSTRHI